MQTGTRLEHYEIVDKLGEGGMGAVYRAEDTRLKRQVAIKVLPPEVSADAERLARLEREAQLLASLNHPNVATVHGFGEADVDDADGARHVAYLAMELVEGDSLYERLAMGPIGWREAARIAAGIASGLEAAHERGIVHRDLKPANVHLTPDGTVKVLDFGLAKAFEADGASGSLELSASPTVAAATRTGIILGTAAYMSPEQARGKPVDKRADIWALGCVLFEMLGGRKSFEGETVSDVLAAILKEEPNLEALPPVPRRLRALLERLLQKDPDQRMRDVGDVRLELEASLQEKESATTEAVAGGLSWGLVGAALGGALLLGLAAGWMLRGSPAPPPEIRAMLAPEAIAGGIDALAISPGGDLVAESNPGDVVRVRRIDDLTWRQLADTEGAFTLSFDATGERLYFSRGAEVLSVGVDGSSPLVEASFEAGTQVYALYRGLDGAVQVSTWRGGDSSIYRIPSGGGTELLWTGNVTTSSRTIVTTQLTADTWVAWLGTASGSNGLAVVGTDISEPAPILTSYRQPLHAEGGEILAVDDRGRLAALTLSLDSGEVLSQPVVRVEGVALLGNVAAFDLAVNGTLAYVSGAVAEAGETLVWIDRDGNETVATERKGSHDVDSRLSPDGRSLALEVAATEDTPISVWIHDLERDVRGALAPGLRGTFPVFSPDGREVALRLGTGIEPEGIYVVPVDRSAPPRLLVAEEEGVHTLPMDWSPDGTTLLYLRSPTLTRSQDAANSIWTIPLGGGEPEAFLDTGASEVDARYSPDGGWIAYRSDQSGQYEIYLRPVGAGGETRVSADGGSNPEFSPAGHELYFLRNNRDLYAVPFDSADTARPVGAQEQILELPGRARGGFYLPSANGQRFMLSMFGGEEQANAVHAIFNWRRNVTDR